MFLLFLFLFGFFAGEFGFGFFLEFIQGADDEEDDEGDDEEVNNTFDEKADVDSGGVAGAKEARDGDFEMTKVDTTDKHTNNWHNDIVHEGGNNRAEGTTNDDTNGEVNDIATVNEFFEFFDNSWFFDLFEVINIWFLHNTIIIALKCSSVKIFELFTKIGETGDAGA